MGRRPSPALVTVLALAAGGILLIQGCIVAPAPAPSGRSARAVKPAGDPEGTPSAGLERLAAEEGTLPITPGPDGKYTQADVDRMMAQQVRLAQELKEEGARKTSDRVQLNTTQPPPQAPPLAAAPAKAPAVAIPSPQTASPQAAPIPNTNAGLSALTGAAPDPSKPTGGVLGVGEPVAVGDPNAPKFAPATAPADERLNAAADELARALRDRAAASKAPAAEFAALAWLDTIRPGVLGSLETGPAAKALDPRQTKSVTLARDMAARQRQDPALFNDPERLWKAMTEVAQPITQAKDVRIATAELCTRVDGFGQYETVKDRALLAGVPHSIVVYAEVDGYNLRKTAEADGERYTVDMGQAVEVWQDADRPTLQRRWSETSIKDVSRRIRRDFYITSVIELPPNLSVGAYNLKIIVKDRLRNAQAEKTIPFTIIADGAIVASGG